MKIQKTQTYWILCVTKDEIRTRIEQGESLYVSGRPNWSKTGAGAPLLEAEEFVYAATGQWDLDQANDPMTFFFPHVCVHLEKDRLPESFECGSKVLYDGKVFELFFQRKLSELELYTVGCLPSDIFLNFDQVYVRQVGKNILGEVEAALHKDSQRNIVVAR